MFIALTANELLFLQGSACRRPSLGELELKDRPGYKHLAPNGAWLA